MTVQATHAKPAHTLFLCTGNSARSILAESILERLGEGRIRAHSAGSQPTGRVHPLALEVLREHGHEVARPRSKSWEEFEEPDAPALDFVFTVCDNAAAERCPIWPGHPMTAHWGLPDPAAFEGSKDDRLEAFRRTYAILERRIERFATIPFDSLDPSDLTKRLDEIGKLTTQAGRKD